MYVYKIITTKNYFVLQAYYDFSDDTVFILSNKYNYSCDNYICKNVCKIKL